MNSDSPDYRGYRYPREIISHAVLLYFRFCRSFRDIEDLIAERGIIVSYETIRQWCRKFGPAYASLSARAVGNLFPIGRHLMRATHYRLLRSRAFNRWQEVTCA